MQKKFKVIIILFLVCTSNVVVAGKLVHLGQKNYKKFADDKGIVILQINWGRQWGCGGLENAQLQKLSFRMVDKGEPIEKWDELKLKTKSKLRVKNEFKPYALMLNPGNYVISGFDVKVAKSKSDIGHLIGDLDSLFEDGKPVGGEFTLKKGEIVYIGHFGLDCAAEPIPWRFYIEGKEEFEEYANGFLEYYPFVKNKDVRFRLFSTTMFGEPYEID